LDVNILAIIIPIVYNIFVGLYNEQRFQTMKHPVFYYLLYIVFMYINPLN